MGVQWRKPGVVSYIQRHKRNGTKNFEFEFICNVKDAPI